VIAESVSLVGFGLDSVIEYRREDVERHTLQIVGWCSIALALYIVYESVSTLLGRAAPAQVSLASLLPGRVEDWRRAP